MALAIVYRFHVALRDQGSARHDLLLPPTRIARVALSVKNSRISNSVLEKALSPGYLEWMQRMPIGWEIPLA
jgi:hypothetical protein